MGDYRLSREHQKHNEALGPRAAAYAHERACREFLESTMGLKLAPGPMNSMGRAAWTKVLISMEAVGDCEADTIIAQTALDRKRRDD